MWKNDCIYNNYNYELKKVLCKCNVKVNFANIYEKSLDKEKLKNNFNVKNLINLKVMKCYKKLFTKDGISPNFGSYILITILFLFIICLIFFIFKGYNSFINRINPILNYNMKIKGKIITF